MINNVINKCIEGIISNCIGSMAFLNVKKCSVDFQLSLLANGYKTNLQG